MLDCPAPPRPAPAGSSSAPAVTNFLLHPSLFCRRKRQKASGQLKVLVVKQILDLFWECDSGTASLSHHMTAVARP